MGRICLWAFLVLSLAACSGDRKLPGSYRLEQWEDGATYYLVGPGSDHQNGGGAIGGVVINIAWNSKLIAAERIPTFGGDPSGWMLIDTVTNKISGPVSKEYFAEIIAKEHLRVLTASEAWSKR